MSGAIKINGTSSGSTTITAPASGGDESIELSTALAAKANTADLVAPGLAHINTSAFSAVTSVSLDNVFTSPYPSYRVLLSFTGQSGDVNVTWRLRASSTDSTASSYSSTRWFATSGGNGTTDASAGTSFSLANHDGPTSEFRQIVTLDVVNPQAATRTLYTGTGWRIGSDGNNYVDLFGGSFTATTQFDGMSVLMSSSASGSISVYGYATA